MISTNGKKGRAEIFVEQWYGDYGTTTISILEKSFSFYHGK